MKGIDISSNNAPIIDWQGIKNAGVTAVIIKATEGTGYKNPYVDNWYKTVKSLGMKVGFYHFAGKNNPVNEYNFFINTIKGYQQDIKPFLDYEIYKGTDFNFIKIFMSQNKDLLFYSSHDIADRTGISKEKIWIAEPGATPTDTKGYAGIQYNCATYLGKNDCEFDMDLFSDDKVLFQEVKDMKTIIVYFGDLDALSAIIVGQKYQCPVMKKSDYDASGLKAEKVIQIGGKTNSTRFTSFKDAASLV